MKKIKQILAILLVLVLVGLYVSTLVFALSGSPDAMNWLKASIYATIVFPVLIWAYSFVYKMLKNRNKRILDQQNSDAPDSTDEHSN